MEIHFTFHIQHRSFNIAKVVFALLFTGLIAFMLSGCYSLIPKEVVSVEWDESLEWPPRIGSDFYYQGVRFNFFGFEGWSIDEKKMTYMGKLFTGGSARRLKPETILGIPVASSYHDLYGYFADGEDVPLAMTNRFDNIWLNSEVELDSPEEEWYRDYSVFNYNSGGLESFCEDTASSVFSYSELIRSEGTYSIHLSNEAISNYVCWHLKLYCDKVNCIFVSHSIYFIDESYYILDQYDEENSTFLLVKLSDIWQERVGECVENLNAG
jgi:hypothetical protein